MSRPLLACPDGASGSPRDARADKQARLGSPRGDTCRRARGMARRTRPARCTPDPAREPATLEVMPPPSTSLAAKSRARRSRPACVPSREGAARERGNPWEKRSRPPQRVRAVQAQAAGGGALGGGAISSACGSQSWNASTCARSHETCSRARSCGSRAAAQEEGWRMPWARGPRRAARGPLHAADIPVPASQRGVEMSRPETQRAPCQRAAASAAVSAHRAASQGGCARPRRAQHL
jgi:hypothetical protein